MSQVVARTWQLGSDSKVKVQHRTGKEMTAYFPQRAEADSIKQKYGL